MAGPNLTAERLRELFNYFPDTGLFIRRIRRSHEAAGKIAGGFDHGYIKIAVDGAPYFAHRMAWLYMTGSWPIKHIDHIDGNRSNNRWNNLRDVSQSENLENRKGPTIQNKVGLLGVTRRGNRYVATLRIDGVQTYLGTYPTPETAHVAYLTAKREHHKGNTL